MPPFVQEKLGPLRMGEGARLGITCPQKATIRGGRDSPQLWRPLHSTLHGQPGVTAMRKPHGGFETGVRGADR